MATPTPTPTITSTPTSVSFQFSSCCTSEVFVVSGYPLATVLNPGEVYDLITNSFSGCATVIAYSGIGTVYTLTSQTGPYIDCSSCAVCPTPTPTPTQPVCVCKEYEIENLVLPSSFVSYTDCLGVEQSFLITNGSTILLCACENTVVAPDGITITMVGECDALITPTPTDTPDATPTQTPTVTSTPNYICSISAFCVNTLFSATTSYDGTYTLAGSYNLYNYYTGNTSGSTYIFNNGTNWCLSDTLGGDCVLFGKTPCYDECPDFNSLIFYSGNCTTTTTTDNCSTFDFEAYFDCDVPSATTTTTIACSATSIDASVVTTTTTSPCNLTALEFSYTSYTTTISATTTTTTTINRNLGVAGNVLYPISENKFDCPYTKLLIDCNTSRSYYTDSKLTYNGNKISTGQTFTTIINGQSVCVTYLENSPNTPDTVIPFITGILTDCSVCTTTEALTPTATPTVTITPTPTITPTS